MKANEPFFILPNNLGFKLALPFEGIIFNLAKKGTKLKNSLEAIDSDLKIEQYLSLSIVNALFLALIFGVLIFLGSTFVAPLSRAISISILLSILIFFIFYFYYLSFPKSLMKRKIRFLESELLFALRYILIKVKSGISLFDALVGVSEGDYGEVSKEFRITVKEISTGIPDIVALENMALRNPSSLFRRTIWQIANNLRSGADISQVLESITSDLVKEQKIMIRRYGSELNPIILMYLMFSIIVPSLGTTVLIIMSSFSGIQVPIYFFYLIPVGVLLLQLFFMKLIKDRKPFLSIG